jgi:hypothetical protein
MVDVDDAILGIGMVINPQMKAQTEHGRIEI